MSRKTDKYNRVLKSYRSEGSRVHGEPVDDASISQAETDLNIRFPESYRWFLSNLGAATWPEKIYGLTPDLGSVHNSNVVALTARERSLIEPRIPKVFVPFSPDGYGNHFCLKCDDFADGECPVVFWDRDRDDNQIAERTHASFLDWLVESIKDSEF